MSDFAIAARAVDNRVSGFVGRNIVRFLTLGSILTIFAVSPMMLYDWGLKYAEEGGNPIDKVHPGTWLALMAFLAAGVGRGNPMFMFDEFVRSRAMALYMFAVAILFAFTIEARKAPFTPWIDTFVLPALLAILIGRMTETDKARSATIIHLVMIANALLGLYEYQTGYRLTSYVAGQFTIEGEWRATALLGHPLVNALLTGAHVLSLALGGGKEIPAWLRPFVMALELVAMIAFGGRSSLVLTLAVLGCVAMLHLGRFLSGARFSPLSASLAFLTLPVVGAVFVNGASAGFFDRMLERFADDNGSASARVTMFRLFDYISWEGIIFGPDPAPIGPLQRALGIEYGIESFWIAFIIMNGLVVSLVFFVGLIAFSLRLAFVTRPSTYVLLGFFYFTVSTSVSISAKTTAFGAYVALVLLMMRAPARR